MFEDPSSLGELEGRNEAFERGGAGPKRGIGLVELRMRPNPTTYPL